MHDNEEQQPKDVEYTEAETTVIDDTETPQEPTEALPTNDKQPKFVRLRQKMGGLKTYYLNHKKLAIPLTVLVAAGLLLAIPTSRYPLVGLGLKKNFTATVLDSKTNKPVSSVEVTLAGKTVKTDQAGVATFERIKVGPHQLVATKKYYKDSQIKAFVPIGGSGGSSELKLDATGRQVKVLVTNKIDGSAVKEAVVSAAETEAKTDDKGETTIVLPADKDNLEAVISGQGYNKLSTKITVTEADTVADQNKFAITPAGKVYFLSKRTGKINVMKSDLDGANAEVVLAATGTEEDGDTVLLASQDWKYLALKSRRNGADKPASLYLIDTANSDKLTTMDEGDATFTMIGWSGHKFVYQVQRDKVQLWQANRQSLKGYDAKASKITVLDNTAGEGTGNSDYFGTDYKSEYYGQTILLANDIVNYTKGWLSGTYTPDGSNLAGKQTAIYTVKADGQDKKLVKGFEAGQVSGVESKLYAPGEVYYRIYVNNKDQYFEYENGNITSKGDLAPTFYSAYPTFLISPNNQQAFWAESRDGKNFLFVGNATGKEDKNIASLSEFAAYGWYTDKYLLLSKNSSELYITGKDNFGTPTKVTDYHKPSTTFYGYGGGYGGL